MLESSEVWSWSSRAAALRVPAAQHCTWPVLYNPMGLGHHLAPHHLVCAPWLLPACLMGVWQPSSPAKALARGVPAASRRCSPALPRCSTTPPAPPLMAWATELCPFTMCVHPAAWLAHAATCSQCQWKLRGSWTWPRAVLQPVPHHSSMCPLPWASLGGTLVLVCKQQ